MIARCALAATVAVAMAAACSGGPALAPGAGQSAHTEGLTLLSNVRDAALTMPHFRNAPVHTDRGKSFVRTPKTKPLLYVGDWSTNDVLVYDYPSGKAVGTLTGFDEPYGMCIDKNANIYITNFGTGDTFEYAFGGTAPIKTFSTGGEPIGCSVSATGDVAITSFSPGQVTVFAHGDTSSSQTYSNYACAYQWPMGYDAKDNLVGVGESSSISICALLHGSSSETTLTPSGITIGFPGGTTWDGKYIALGDQQAGGAYITGMWPSTISGSTITAAGSEITFTDDCYSDDTDVVDPFVTGKKSNITPNIKVRANTMIGPNLWCLYPGAPKVNSWAYPAGGPPKGTLPMPPPKPMAAAAVRTPRPHGH